MKKTNDNFKNIIGYESIKKELRLVADILKNPEKYTRLGATAPSGVLLVGPPGTGKSTLAEAFVKECECESVLIRKKKASDQLVFQMNSAFEKARQNTEEGKGYTVIALDDFDKFENNDVDNDYKDTFVALQSNLDNAKQDGTKVLVIITANNVRALPRSLKRRGRIDLRLKVGRPTDKDAKAIIEYYLKDKKCKGLDIDAIVKIVPSANCAELESIMNNAAILAVSAGKEFITMDEIYRAALREIFGAPEVPAGYPKKMLHLLAVHEAGHAIIAELQKPGTVNLVALTKTEGEGPNAVTSVYRGDNELPTIEDYENKIRELLGGRAATEILMGKVDTGTGSDLPRAYNMIRRLASYSGVWGFDTHVYEFEDISRENEEMNDKLCSTKIANYYAQAIKILVENRSVLEALVKELEENIIVTRKDIEKIFKQMNSKNEAKEAK